MAQDAPPAPLRAGALSLFESVVMGLAGSAPGFSIATTLAVLFAAAGHLAINALILFALPMLGIAVAFSALNRTGARAGAAYDWTRAAFGRGTGFLSGWAMLVSTLVFMVSGSLTLGTSLIGLFAPAAAPGLVATSLVGAAATVAIGLVLIAGIGITSWVQVAMTSIELLILAVVALAAFWHAARHGLPQAPRLEWLGFGYGWHDFVSTAIVVVFFYWGWDVTANLGEETAAHPANAAGRGGTISVVVTAGLYVAYAVAAMSLFTVERARTFDANIVARIAEAAGLGPGGARTAAAAVMLSSVATMETSMLQFTRCAFSMSRDLALPAILGAIDPRTRTPVRGTLVLVVLGVGLIAAASLLPSVATVMTDSVNAGALQVCFYYALTGLTCAWVYRDLARLGAGPWLGQCVVPLLSAAALLAIGAAAILQFDRLTDLVGFGGLAIGLLFVRPGRLGVRP